eukprot:m51a1_g12381 hypothetical protein (227) ;mRNA; f:622917-623597
MGRTYAYVFLGWAIPHQLQGHRRTADYTHAAALQLTARGLASRELGAHLFRWVAEWDSGNFYVALRTTESRYWDDGPVVLDPAAMARDARELFGARRAFWYAAHHAMTSAIVSVGGGGGGNANAPALVAGTREVEGEVRRQVEAERAAARAATGAGGGAALGDVAATLHQSVLVRIYAFLDGFAVCAAARVCRHWRRVANSQELQEARGFPDPKYMFIVDPKTDGE